MYLKLQTSGIGIVIKNLDAVESANTNDVLKATSKKVRPLLTSLMFEDCIFKLYLNEFII